MKILFSLKYLFLFSVRVVDNTFLYEQLNKNLAIETQLSELVFLKIHTKSNLLQFLLQYCRLQDAILNENVLHQRVLDKSFQENVLAKEKFYLPLHPLPSSLLVFP